VWVLKLNLVRLKTGGPLKTSLYLSKPSLGPTISDLKLLKVGSLLKRWALIKLKGSQWAYIFLQSNLLQAYIYFTQ
jgi:hypothetical protein